MIPSPRDLIDWLALFVAPQCETQQQMLMYIAVRDALVRQFGMLTTPDEQVPPPPPQSSELAEITRLREALTAAEDEARRYAEFYPQSSDGRNTFILLADHIAALAATPPPPR